MVLGSEHLRIPDALAQLSRWLLWRSVDGRKVPYKIGGYPAKSTEPRDWTDVQAAYAALHRGGYNGLGFVFAEGDGLVGIDLDDCFLEEALAPEQLKPWAATLVGALSATYTEVSPSGTGLKAWCRGTIPRSLKTPIEFQGQPDGAIEVYSKARYFAFTGQRYGDCPLEVTDCQAVIDFIFDSLAPQREFETKEYPVKFTHGTQHNNLLRILGVLRRHSVCPQAIEACLQVVNREQCELPGPPENIMQMVRSSTGWDGNDG